MVNRSSDKDVVEQLTKNEDGKLLTNRTKNKSDNNHTGNEDCRMINEKKMENY